MPVLRSDIAAHSLADHEIHLFYEIDGLRLDIPATTFGSLFGNMADCFPPDQLSALKNRYRNDPIWQAAEGDVGVDYHDHVRDLAAGRRKDLAVLWKLAPTAERLLKRADLYEEGTPPTERVRKRLILNLSDRSQVRMRTAGLAPRAMSIAIEAVTLHAFGTGKSFAHAIVVITPLNGPEPLRACELLEALVALSRFNDLSWQPSDAPAASGDANRFGLGLLIRRLVTGAETTSIRSARVSTYTYAQLSDGLARADVDLLAVHLARHYTSDYVISPDIRGVERIQAFQTMNHAVALEGAATIVAPAAAGESIAPFLTHFKTGTFRQHYVPIALLALHEHAFLVDRTSRSIISPDDNISRIVHALERLREDSLFFRIRYRFSELSRITMHNELYRAFRRVFRLDGMLEEFASDIAEVEAYLRAIEEQRSQERFHWLTVVGGAALAGLTAFTIFRETLKTALEALAHHFNFLRPIEHWDAHHVEILSGFGGILIGLIVAAVAWFFGRKRRPHGGSRAGHLLRHAAWHNVFDVAKE